MKAISISAGVALIVLAGFFAVFRYLTFIVELDVPPYVGMALFLGGPTAVVVFIVIMRDLYKSG